jgi:hypothetical protein
VGHRRDLAGNLVTTIRIETIPGETGKAIAEVIRSALIENPPFLVGAIDIDRPIKTWGGKSIGPTFATVQVSVNVTGEQVAEILRLATDGVIDTKADLGVTE